MPDAVVLAEDTADVAATLAIAEKHGVPVTPRAGGTGRTGGAGPGRRRHRARDAARWGSILEIDRQNLLAVVQPGLVTADLHAAVEAEGLFYPPDPELAEDVHDRRQRRRERRRSARLQVRRDARVRPRARGVPHGRPRPPHRQAHHQGRHRLRRDGAPRRQRGHARRVHRGDAEARAEADRGRHGARALRRRARRRRRRSPRRRAPGSCRAASS